MSMDCTLWSNTYLSNNMYVYKPEINIDWLIGWLTMVVEVSIGRDRLEAKNFYDINNISQMKIFILVYEMKISDISSPISPLRNVIYLSKICGFRDNLLGRSWNISLFYCLLEFPLFETGSDTYISPINCSRCQGTRLLLLALKGLHSGALVQEDSEGGYSAEEILQLALHNILLRCFGCKTY